MKSFLNVLIFIFMFATLGCEASEQKILVLPDNFDAKIANYYIYPDASEILSTDIINYFNTQTTLRAPSVSRVRQVLGEKPRQLTLAKETMKRFKYTYNVDFVALKRIAQNFGANRVLLVTSGIDPQNYILRRTFWDFLNIAGATVIDPAYRLSTNIVLIDSDNEVILWQNTYYRSLSKLENRIIANDFGPAYEQLNKIKFYSSYITPVISNKVAMIIAPPPTPEELKSVEAKVIDVVENPARGGQDPNYRPTFAEMKPFLPTKPSLKKNGFNIQGGMVNDF